MKKAVLFGELESFYEIISMFICTTNLNDCENAHIDRIYLNTNDSQIHNGITILKGKEHLEGLTIKSFVLSNKIAGSTYQSLLKNGKYSIKDLRYIHNCYINISYKDLFLKIDNIMFCEKNNVYLTPNDDINNAICALLSKK